MQLRTLTQAMEYIKENDQNTALNLNFLSTLAENGTITSAKHGNRTLVDVLLLLGELRKIMGVPKILGTAHIPQIRSIRDAAKELKEKDSDTAITEDFIRKLVDDGRVKALTCGTKQLVAMESFTCPRKLLGDMPTPSSEKNLPAKVRTASAAAREEADKLIENAAIPFRCTREVG